MPILDGDQVLVRIFTGAFDERRHQPVAKIEQQLGAPAGYAGGKPFERPGNT